MRHPTKQIVQDDIITEIITLPTPEGKIGLAEVLKALFDSALAETLASYAALEQAAVANNNIPPDTAPDVIIAQAELKSDDGQRIFFRLGVTTTYCADDTCEIHAQGNIIPSDGSKIH